MMMMSHQNCRKLVAAGTKMFEYGRGIARIGNRSMAIAAQNPDVVVGKGAQSQYFQLSFHRVFSLFVQ